MKKSGALTAYQQLANRLRQQILAGTFVAGARLPTEFELCTMFGASRITVRRSLQILEEELLIRRRQGSGTYVSPQPARKIPLLNVDFSGSVQRHAPELRRTVHDWGWQPAGAGVAETLEIEHGTPILHARRIDSVQRTPVAFDDVYVPASFADKLDSKDLGKIQFVERWCERQGMRLSHLKQTLESVIAVAELADILGVSRQSSLLKETTTYHLRSGRPAGLFVTYYRSDLFRFTSTAKLDDVRQTARSVG